LLKDKPRTRRIKTDAEWAEYQHEQVAPEVKLKSGDPLDDVWADGIEVDPDTVVAVEVKYVVRVERSMYQGDLPQPFLDTLLYKFDAEIERYGKVIRHPDNPVGRLRLIVSTEKAKTYLSARVRRILGNDIDLDVQVRPKKKEKPA